MVQVAAWFVAGVAWPAAWVSDSTMRHIETVGVSTGKRDEPVFLAWLALWLLSSGVAVAATAVALGVGQ